MAGYQFSAARPTKCNERQEDFSPSWPSRYVLLPVILVAMECDYAYKGKAFPLQGVYPLVV